MNVNAQSKRTSSTAANVAAKSSSVSPGEADDDVGAEREIGNRGAQPLDEAR